MFTMRSACSHFSRYRFSDCGGKQRVFEQHCTLVAICAQTMQRFEHFSISSKVSHSQGIRCNSAEFNERERTCTLSRLRVYPTGSGEVLRVRRV